jgi:hypothetical protein
MPMTVPDSPELNQIAMRLAAGLAAVFALMAILLHQELLPWSPKHPESRPITATAPPTQSPLTFAALDRRITFCAQHVTPERCFVVFQNGTCVIIEEPAPDPIAEAKEILSKTSGPEARFLTRRIEEGHLMVTYREPVFHCLFRDEITLLAPDLGDQFKSHLSPSERKSMPPGWNPPADAQLGLLTRTSLNKDASALQIAKVVRSRALPANDGAASLPGRNAPAEAQISPPPAHLQVSLPASKLQP